MFQLELSSNEINDKLFFACRYKRGDIVKLIGQARDIAKRQGIADVILDNALVIDEHQHIVLVQMNEFFNRVDCCLLDKVKT